MTTSQTAPFYRERRVQLLVAGGLIMIVALTAFAPHHERALFVDENGAAKAFGAIALPPPVVGTLKRFGWVGGDVLARAFSPALPGNRFATGRRIAGNDLPAVDEFVAALAPALPLTGDARGLSGPGDEGSLRIASPGLPGNAATGGLAPGGGTGVSGGGGSAGGGGGGGVPAAEPVPVATPTPGATPTPTPTPAATPTPSATPLPSSTPEPVATPAPAPSAVPTPTPVTNPAPPVVSPVPAASPSPAPTPVADPTAAPTPVPTATPEPVASPTPTLDPDPMPTPEPMPSGQPTPEPPADPEPVAAVPEPSTWAMIIVGFALVGAGLRRSAKRRAAKI